MNRALTPKRPAWFRNTAVAIGASLLVYAAAATIAPWRPGRLGGLVFGTIAAFFFVFDGAYPLRRRLLAWPLATAQRWLQLHIYGGTAALVCVFIHVGFAWPRGAMGWWLIGLSIWTVATGVLGVLVQKWVPIAIARSLQVEALAARIPQLTARLAGEADRLMAGASDRLLAAYQAEIRPRLQHPAPDWAYVANAQSGRLRYADALDRIERTVADAARVRDLRAIVMQKAELDVHLSLQRALRAWLVLHVPPAAMLLALLAVHIFAVLYL